jgi:hypothetical protein
MQSYSSSSKYHALNGGGGASDVLPFPAESATVNGGAVCCPLFVVVVWSVLSASEVVTKMILMGHPVSFCHVPVVRSCFILFQTSISSYNFVKFTFPYVS